MLKKVIIYSGFPAVISLTDIVKYTTDMDKEIKDIEKKIKDIIEKEDIENEEKVTIERLLNIITIMEKTINENDIVINK